MSSLHAVILAGGAGQRFWPRSRRRHPKPLLRVQGSESLLAATLRRARRFAAADHVWIVCGAAHAGAMRRESGLPSRRVLVEPRGRNTAMAAGWAAERIDAEFPGALLATLPADHWIPDAAAFARAIRSAARAAQREGVLVTLGIQPTRPETGYGYIQVGRAVGKTHKRLHRVARFVEKPDASRARRYLRKGYLWNAGVFVWSAAALREEIQTHAPALHRALGPVRARPRGAGARAALERAYRRAPSQPIDVAVLERSRKVWTLPADFRWSDVGSWASLADALGVGPEASRVIEGRALLEDAPANLVWGERRLIALLGVEGLAVIDTPDALLVASLERSADVRRLVERLATRRDRSLT